LRTLAKAGFSSDEIQRIAETNPRELFGARLVDAGA
jgi:predicted metal-dependent phosphotriesterase family hydrolase